MQYLYRKAACRVACGKRKRVFAGSSKHFALQHFTRDGNFIAIFGERKMLGKVVVGNFFVGYFYFGRLNFYFAFGLFDYYFYGCRFARNGCGYFVFARQSPDIALHGCVGQSYFASVLGQREQRRKIKTFCLSFFNGYLRLFRA